MLSTIVGGRPSIYSNCPIYNLSYSKPYSFIFIYHIIKKFLYIYDQKIKLLLLHDCQKIKVLPDANLINSLPF